MDELTFYVTNAKKINKKYAGKHIAIIGNKVVASGHSPKEVWEKAKKINPKKTPTLAFVPKGDTLVLILG